MLAVATASGSGGVAWPAREQAAPPDQFIVRTGTGDLLTGAPARVEVRFADAARPPAIEIALSATDAAGTWSALVAAPADLLGDQGLELRVVPGPLEPGAASVQWLPPSGETSFAATGRIRLTLRAGRLSGEASGMSAQLQAKFDGPLVVTCAVPAACLGVTAPAPASEGGITPLVVDSALTSSLCAPYRRLVETAGRRDLVR